ncbi:glycosyltransferase family 2 protein [Pseudomonas sp. GM17]|uniref:glycosyltransferase family 2 protein n=1 Tax=Pseudomonas sp. GM17 TaxID=1144323 RepID=UPI0002723EEF|nr:glycosyltransferase family 2 protein [Pseudomonas sp. GM17]WIE48887.1 glycosyltransferase family 2 protein [Pseudomonas sp. GM17]
MSIFMLNTPSSLWSNDLCTAKVAILMCSYNGESFLSEQLESIERQSYRNWTLMVSDDGSQDRTLTILQAYGDRWGSGRLSVAMGPKRGFVANFLSLTCRTDIEADFFAWSDQDDIWGEDKLQVALDWLQTIPAQVPALYCGRTQLVSDSGATVGYSPCFSLPPRFANALVQSIAGGNTMVFNQAARVLIREAGAGVKIPSHDWWAYLLVTGAGGVVYYDPEPKMQYRQHDENLIGSNSGWAASLVRLRMVFQGRFYEWSEQNIHALEAMQHRLCEEHQVTLARFKGARGQTLFRRVLGIRLAGLYRQTFLGNLGLILATLLKKI